MMQEPGSARGDWARGIDISERQGAIDWSRIYGAGIAFAYTMATRGGSQRDARFAANWERIKAAEILRGAIHLFHPARNVEAQVENFAASVGKLESADLPPALQLASVPSETGLEQWHALQPDESRARVLEWLEAVAQTTGKAPVIFFSHRFQGAYLSDTAALSKYDLWIAHDTYTELPTPPSGWSTWKFWRHAENGSAAGVSSPVSLDRFNGTVRDLREYAMHKPVVGHAAVDTSNDVGDQPVRPDAEGDQSSESGRARRPRSAGKKAEDR
jgi:lysozyme